jgi:hypothetical protein
MVKGARISGVVSIVRQTDARYCLFGVLKFLHEKEPQRTQQGSIRYSSYLNIPSIFLA